MSFKETVALDNLKVFLNNTEFADKRNVRYDGVVYPAIPIVLSGLKEQDRTTLQSDHAEGLYKVSSVLHCALDDLNGLQPEKGTRIEIADEDNYYKTFYVASSVCEMGMLRIELEAIDE